MLELWGNLVPLILASAALPLQTIIALQLVRSSGRAAFAWVAGMTAVRLVQGFLFGVVFSATEERAGPDSPRFFLAGLLLILALMLYVKALRKLLGAEDEDAPPPQWLTKAGSMSPLAAFAAGAGFMTVSVKFLVFTLGAISAIAEAHLDARLSALTFVLFVVLAELAPLTILTLAAISSSQSAAILDAFSAWLRRNNRVITVLIGVVFGTWFLLKALKQLHLI
jgi:Sap, sulfolipid-1-addressing protein